MQFLFSDDVRRNPFPWYDELRAASPVLRLPGSNKWLLFDYDSVNRALTDHAAFSSVVSPPGTRTAQWLLFSDPPRHSKLRALISRAFTPRAVAALEPRIRDISRELLDAVTARAEIDLVADYAVPLPLRVIAELLGAPADDYPRFRRWGDVILRLAHTVTDAPDAASAIESFIAVHGEMERYLPSLLEERRHAPRDDLLTRLLAAEVDGQHLTMEEMLGFFQLLLLAGHETTTNLIDNAVLCFLEHPAQRDRLIREPALLASAIEEVLRFRSPVQASMRVARAPTQLHGQDIPAGALVIAMIGSANRDPRVFERANAFDIARAPNPHLAFGHGIHFCIGAPLARLEASVAIPDLLAHLGSAALASDEPWEPREAFHVHGPSRLVIRFGGRAGTRS